MLELIWSPAARDELSEILDYISQFNEDASENLRARIDSLVEKVQHHPQLFRSGRVPGTREIVAHPNYIVVYRVLAEHIEVVSVVHARQEYP